MSENNNRISCLNHLPPSGGIEHGHHVLNFHFHYNRNENQSPAHESRKFIVKKESIGISQITSCIHWEVEFKDLDAYRCYKKWLTFYNTWCNEFIPKSSN